MTIEQEVVAALNEPTLMLQCIAIRKVLKTHKTSKFLNTGPTDAWVEANSTEILRLLPDLSADVLYYECAPWRRAYIKNFYILPLPQQEGRWTYSYGQLVFANEVTRFR